MRVVLFATKLSFSTHTAIVPRLVFASAMPLRGSHQSCQYCCWYFVLPAALQSLRVIVLLMFFVLASRCVGLYKAIETQSPFYKVIVNCSVTSSIVVLSVQYLLFWRRHCRGRATWPTVRLREDGSFIHLPRPV